MLVTDLAELGELIRRRRTELGLSQTALAEQVGSTRQWVSRLELGKNDISTARLFAVLDALELNLDLRPPRAMHSMPGSSTTMRSIIPAESLNAIARSVSQLKRPDQDQMLKSLTAVVQSITLPDRSEMLKNMEATIEGLRASQQFGARPERPESSELAATSPERPDAQP